MILVESFPVLLEIAGGAVALVLVLLRTTGRVRALAGIGLVLIMAGFLTAVIFNVAMGSRLREVAADDLLGVLAAQNVVRVLLIGAGVILLAVAVTIGGRAGPSRSSTGRSSRSRPPGR